MISYWPHVLLDRDYYLDYYILYLIYELPSVYVLFVSFSTVFHTIIVFYSLVYFALFCFVLYRYEMMLLFFIRAHSIFVSLQSHKTVTFMDLLLRFSNTTCVSAYVPSKYLYSSYFWYREVWCFYFICFVLFPFHFFLHMCVLIPAHH